MTDYEYDETTSGAETGTAAGRHPLNITHLVMGIAFLGFVAVWATIATDLVHVDDLRWMLPVPWVLAGLGGLLAIAFGSRRTDSR